MKGLVITQDIFKSEAWTLWSKLEETTLLGPENFMSNVEDCRILKYEPDLINELQDSHDFLYFNSIEDLEPRIKLKIPYFYNIYPETFTDEFNYRTFASVYSQAKGANLVFVSDKKLNKYSNWLGLNSYFINEPINNQSYPYVKRVFNQRELRVGFISSNEDNSYRNKILKDIIGCKKNHWKFLTIKSGNPLDDLADDLVSEDRELFSKCHVYLETSDISLGVKNDKPYENLALKAMSQGAVVIKCNPHGNNTHIMFDDFHYLKVDFNKQNTYLDLLRYADKKRHKLEMISKQGSAFVSKYHNLHLILEDKINLIKRNLR